MRIVLFGVLVSFCLSGYGQSTYCLSVQEGKFQIVSDEIGTHTVIRTKTHQIEINKGHNYEAKFDIVWIDDCTYELKNKQLVRGFSKFSGNKGDVFRGEIIEVKENSIVVRCSSNFADLVTDVEMNIVHIKKD